LKRKKEAIRNAQKKPGGRPGFRGQQQNQFDFARRTGRPVRNFGTATTKPGKYDENSLETGAFRKSQRKSKPILLK
jgi:hypothetical protein